MKAISRTACTLAALFAAHFTSPAAVTVFQNNLPGFLSTAGSLPILDFDSLLIGPDLAGATIHGITFTSPLGNTLEVVRAATTFSDSGLTPPGDSFR